ncbi:MAG: hypothetical protein LBM66_01075 [Bifidobacteriaceae bacterium]|jgi:hypothetical protein|nr:hypothetical protein [Bifidobacteriaceae bacterium]
MNHPKFKVCAALAVATTFALAPIAATAANAAPRGAAAQDQTGSTQMLVCHIQPKVVGDTKLTDDYESYSYLAGHSFKVKLKVTTHSSRCNGTAKIYDGKKKLKTLKVKHGKWATYKFKNSLAVKKHKIKVVYKSAHSSDNGASTKFTLYKVSTTPVTATLAHTTGSLAYQGNYYGINASVTYTGPIDFPDFYSYRSTNLSGWDKSVPAVSAKAGEATRTFSDTISPYLDTEGSETIPVGTSFTETVKFSPEGEHVGAVSAPVPVTVAPDTLKVVVSGGNPVAGTITAGRYQFASTATSGCSVDVTTGDSDAYSDAPMGGTTLVTLIPGQSVNFMGCLGGPIPA